MVSGDSHQQCPACLFLSRIFSCKQSLPMFAYYRLTGHIIHSTELKLCIISTTYDNPHPPNHTRFYRKQTSSVAVLYKRLEIRRWWRTYGLCPLPNFLSCRNNTTHANWKVMETFRQCQSLVSYATHLNVLYFNGMVEEVG